MKKLLSLTLILISLISLNCSNANQEATVNVNADKELALKVDGMVCAVGCAKYIEKQVAEMNGVSDCKVSFEEGVAKIEFSSEVTNQEEIVSAITSINDGQYSVSVVELTNVKAKSTSTPKSSGSEKNETEVSIQFPELVTYFLSRVISRV